MNDVCTGLGASGGGLAGVGGVVGCCDAICCVRKLKTGVFQLNCPVQTRRMAIERPVWTRLADQGNKLFFVGCGHLGSTSMV